MTWGWTLWALGVLILGLGNLYVAARFAGIRHHWYPILKSRPRGFERFPSGGWVFVWGRLTVVRRLGREL